MIFHFKWYSPQLGLDHSHCVYGSYIQYHQRMMNNVMKLEHIGAINRRNITQTHQKITNHLQKITNQSPKITKHRQTSHTIPKHHPKSKKNSKKAKHIFPLWPTPSSANYAVDICIAPTLPSQWLASAIRVAFCPLQGRFPGFRHCHLSILHAAQNIEWWLHQGREAFHQELKASPCLAWHTHKKHINTVHVPRYMGTT